MPEVEVGLHPQQRVDERRVAHGGAEPPPRHIVRLGQRVELDAHVHRPRRLHERRRDVAVERHLRVRRVVADRHVVALGEIDRLAEERLRRQPARRIVGVVEPQHRRPLRDLGGDRVQDGQPAALLRQRHEVRRAAREHRADRVDRIARIRHERDAPRVDEAQRHMADALFRADQGQDLFRGIEPQPKTALVPARQRLPEFGQAVALRVSVVGGVVRRALECVHDALRRRDVRVADAERDDVEPGGALGLNLAADLEEEVRRQAVEAVGELHASPLCGRFGGEASDARAARYSVNSPVNTS